MSHFIASIKIALHVIQRRIQIVKYFFENGHSVQLFTENYVRYLRLTSTSTIKQIAKKNYRNGAM